MSDKSPGQEAMLAALHAVVEPRSGRDVVALGFVRDVTCRAGVALVPVQLPPELASDEVREVLREQIQAALTGLDGVGEVRVEFQVVRRSLPEALANVKHVIAIGAGKGGVGKSTVAVFLAVGLKRLGLRVGLLDGDVYGPSLPKLTGTEGAQPLVNDQGRVVPPEFEGIKIISMGYLVPPGQAVIWRGPLAQKYVLEFLERGEWGDLDYLIVDLPPGTGDIPLTLAQSIPLTGSVVVCTPQDLALADAVKALRMYQKLGVEPLGFVENMSYYVLPDGQRDYIFGQGGVRRAAAELNVPYLGEIPLYRPIREFGDAGKPLGAFTEAAQYVVASVEHFVKRLTEEVAARSRQRVPLPQLNIGG